MEKNLISQGAEAVIFLLFFLLISNQIKSFIVDKKSFD